MAFYKLRRLIARIAARGGQVEYLIDINKGRIIQIVKRGEVLHAGAVNAGDIIKRIAFSNGIEKAF